MREYGQVSPAFWIGATGKLLRGDSTAQLLALYLITSPHSTMTGVFHCPLMYMAHETGLTLKGASKGLQRLIEVGFCEYEEASETVFVVQMAKFQIAKSLKPNDNRITGLRKDIRNMQSDLMRQRFLAIHSEAFCLNDPPDKPAKTPKKTSPLEAPSKPPRSQEQEQEQDINIHTSVADEILSPDKPTTAVEQIDPDDALGDADLPPPTKTGKAGQEKRFPPCPAEQIVELYREALPELPNVRVMDDSRKKLIANRWKWVLSSTKNDGSRRAENAKQAVDWFRDFFELTRENDFLMGRTPRVNGHANWKCDIDFLMSDKGLKQVLEKTGVAA